MKHRAIIIAAALLMTACAGHPDQVGVVIPQTVNKPVAASCVPVDYPAEPVYVDNDAALKAAPDFTARMQLILTGRLQRITRGDQDNIVINGCK